MKRWTFRIAAVVLSLLICLFFLEIGLRMWGPEYYRFHNRLEVYYSNPRGYFDLVGHQDGQPVYGLRYHTEGSPRKRVPDDLEDTEEQRAFLARKTTVLGLGDSFTYGSGVRFEDTYLSRLENLLTKDGTRAKINNTGHRDHDLKQICDLYDVESARRRYPLVIYGFVLNDFDPPNRNQIVGLDYINFNSGGYSYNPWRKRIATVNFIAHRIQTIRLDRVTRRLYRESFQGDNAREHFQLLAGLHEKVEMDGGNLVIVLFPMLYDFDDYPFQEIHDQIADFCRDRSIPLLDLLPAFSRHRAEDLWVHVTDHHPNEIAHRIAAEELHPFLQREGLLALLSVQTPREGEFENPPESTQ